MLAALALSWLLQFAARASPGAIPTGVSSPLAAFEGDEAIGDREAWTTRRVPLVRSAFVSRIYGALPQTIPSRTSVRTIDAAAFDGAARLDVLTLDLASGDTLQAALYTPTGNGPFPAIVATDFCGLDADVDPRLPRPAWRQQRCRSGLGRTTTTLLHGEAILRPPVRAMVERGYAVAIFFAGDIAPDDPVLFREAQINRLGATHQSGAIATWAALYLSVFDTIRADPRIAPMQIALWGHSRYAKAALLAGALDERVGAVIANQSGTFGATLAGATRGESVRQIERRFPHWFDERLKETNGNLGDLDQQFLLATIAPRPVLLGNAGLDRWSDPAAAFAAARAASHAYGLFGSAGLAQPSMRDTRLDADIAFYVRPGGHGVRASDWDMALAFLDYHFATQNAHAPAQAR